MSGTYEFALGLHRAPSILPSRTHATRTHQMPLPCAKRRRSMGYSWRSLLAPSVMGFSTQSGFSKRALVVKYASAPLRVRRDNGPAGDLQNHLGGFIIRSYGLHCLLD